MLVPAIINVIKEQAKKNVKFLSLNESKLKITENALEKIVFFRKKKPEYLLRINIGSGGCQGFVYDFINEKVLNIAQLSKDIVIIDAKDILIVFDLFSEFYLAGANLDYEETMLKTGFKILNNPKAKSLCGCSKSFDTAAVYNDEVESC